MARIPEETVEQILAATDIVDLISSYLPLKRAGGSFKALCPFHSEKTPSFYVNPGTQTFKCFGCGQGGTAVGFVMDYENLPFPDAIRKLAQRASISITEETYDPEADRARRSRSRLITLHQAAAEFMHQCLMKDPAAQHARDYLKSRGFGGDMAKRWTLGWMPENPRVFLDWAREAKFTGRELKDSGLAKLQTDGNPRSGLWVRFRDRLMFPIRSDYGDVIAFSGRQLRDDPRSGKYINSPETPIFKKSKVFFALDRARRPMAKEHCGLICEGQLDVIACHEAGIENAFATLGTACTSQHARLLKRFTDHVVLCYDADSAGHKAVDRAFRELAPFDLNIRVVSLPPGEDPDSIIQKSGPDAFRQMVAEAVEFFDYKITHERGQRDLTQAGQVAELARELASLLSVLTDRVTKDTALNHVATRLGIGIDEFREAVRKAGRKAGRRPTRRALPDDDDTPAPRPPTILNPGVAALCRLALLSNTVLDWLCEQTEPLLDALEGRPGEQLLRLILSKRPDCSSPAATNTFLTTLEGPDRAALLPLLEDPLPEDPLRDAEKILGTLSLMALERQIASTEARLRDPNLPAEEMIRLMEEIKDLQRLRTSAKNS